MDRRSGGQLHRAPGSLIARDGCFGFAFWMRIANFAGAKSRAQHSAPGPGVSDSQRGERQRRKPACQQLVTTVTHPRYYVALNVPSQSVLIDEAPRACLPAGPCAWLAPWTLPR